MYLPDLSNFVTSDPIRLFYKEAHQLVLEYSQDNQGKDKRSSQDTYPAQLAFGGSVIRIKFSAPGGSVGCLAGKLAR
jgi:hypothetical protein